jgi:hypothetical protein
VTYAGQTARDADVANLTADDRLTHTKKMTKVAPVKALGVSTQASVWKSSGACITSPIGKHDRGRPRPSSAICQDQVHVNSFLIAGVGRPQPDSYPVSAPA